MSGNCPLAFPECTSWLVSSPQTEIAFLFAAATAEEVVAAAAALAALPSPSPWISFSLPTTRHNASQLLASQGSSGGVWKCLVPEAGKLDVTAAH